MSMMITISLNEIKEQGPCESGWKKVLKSKGGTKADMDAQFPLTDILESSDLDDTLWCLRCRPEHSNLWRKFAVWAARQVESKMTDERSRNALDVAWRHSDGEATDADLAAARDTAWDATRYTAWDAARYTARYAARAAAMDAARAAARDAALGAAMDAAWGAAWDAAGAYARDAGDAARGAQKAKLIQILTAGEWAN